VRQLARSVVVALASISAPLALGALIAPAARAVEEHASLQASFSPNRLGAPTTISFSFHVSTAEGAAPPPMTALDLQLPAGMNYTTTTLGLATCDSATLLARGLAGCPANSRLGHGSALVEVPFGVGSGHEIPEIQAVAGPSPKGNLVVLFYANGLYPVYAQLSFSGEVLPDSGRFGSQLSANVPLVTSVPGGPDVSVVSVQTTIGPNQLTYYRRVHGRLQPFKPRGVAVPERCPRGGFPFSAQFSFLDGTTTSATAAVACPPPARRAR
jgi:hypothetical protein